MILTKEIVLPVISEALEPQIFIFITTVAIVRLALTVMDLCAVVSYYLYIDTLIDGSIFDKFSHRTHALAWSRFYMNMQIVMVTTIENTYDFIPYHNTRLDGSTNALSNYHIAARTYNVENNVG